MAAQAGSTTLEATRCAAADGGSDAPSGSSPMSCGPLPNEQIEWSQHEHHQQADRPARRAPAVRQDDRLQPGQQHDAANAHAGEGDADRQARAAARTSSAGTASAPYRSSCWRRRRPEHRAWRRDATAARSRARGTGQHISSEHAGQDHDARAPRDPSRDRRSGSTAPTPGSRTRTRRRRGPDPSRTRRSAAASAARRRCVRRTPIAIVTNAMPTISQP